MKVLHINCNYLDTALHQLLIEELDNLGIENKVFVPTNDRNRAVIELNSNVVVSECFKQRDRILFDYKQHKILKAIESNINIAEFDLIHAYTLFTDGNIARILSQKYKIPYVVAVRNTDVNDFFKKMVHLRGRGLMILKNAKSVFFLSEAYKKTVFTKYIPKSLKLEIMDKVHIIPNGIDNFWFENIYQREREKKADKTELIYAGRIDRNKNIEMIQNAMKLLKNTGIETHLTVVGKVVDNSVYRKIVRNMSTTILPAMKKDELIKLYREADVFVMPSFTESFGLVYVEAMTQGLPVVYSSGQGFDGQFPDGEVGYSVDANSAQSVAKGIQNAIEHQDEITYRVASNAMKFNWREISQMYKAIYLS